MKRFIILAVTAAALGACENAQDPTTTAAVEPQFGKAPVAVIVTMRDEKVPQIGSAFSESAMYRRSPRSLKFDSGPSVEYLWKTNQTVGQGILTGTDSLGVTWTVDLSQRQLNRSGNQIRQNTDILACANSGRCRLVKMIWS